MKELKDIFQRHKITVNYKQEDPLRGALPGYESASAIHGWHSQRRAIFPRRLRVVYFSFPQGTDSNSLVEPPRGYRFPDMHEVAALLKVMVGPPARLWFPGVVRIHDEESCRSSQKGGACPHGPCKEFLVVHAYEGGVRSYSANVPRVFCGWSDDDYIVLVEETFDWRKWERYALRILGVVMIFLVFYLFTALVLLSK